MRGAGMEVRTAVEVSHMAGREASGKVRNGVLEKKILEQRKRK